MKYVYEDYDYPSFYEGEVNDKIEAALDEIVCRIKRHSCPCCGKPVEFDHIDMYDHFAGWEVVPEMKKQWLSVHCDYCNYDISLNKLGVRR